MARFCKLIRYDWEYPLLVCSAHVAGLHGARAVGAQQFSTQPTRLQLYIAVALDRAGLTVFIDVTRKSLLAGVLAPPVKPLPNASMVYLPAAADLSNSSAPCNVGVVSRFDGLHRASCVPTGQNRSIQPQLWLGEKPRPLYITAMSRTVYMWTGCSAAAFGSRRYCTIWERRRPVVHTAQYTSAIKVRGLGVGLHSSLAIRLLYHAGALWSASSSTAQSLYLLAQLGYSEPSGFVGDAG